MTISKHFQQCSSYTYFTLPYAGKPESSDKHYVTGADNYMKYLADGLIDFVDIRGCNINLNRNFTSLPIAENLLQKKITVVGTMRINIISFPKEFLDMKDKDDTFTIHVMDENK